MSALKLYKLSHLLYYKYNLKFLSKIIDKIIYYLYNSYISGSCNISENTTFAYSGIGLVIHSNAIIGKNCVIGQGITIGGKSGSPNVPIIEDNVYIGAGARILGDLTIGHHSIVAPNSVVLKDIEPFSIYAGIPAKKIGEITENNKSKYQDYVGKISFEGK